MEIELFVSLNYRVFYNSQYNGRILLKFPMQIVNNIWNK